MAEPAAAEPSALVPFQPAPVAPAGLPAPVIAPVLASAPTQAPSPVLSWVQAGAGVLAAISTFLPWVNRSVSGVDVTLLPGRGVGSVDGFGEYPTFADPMPDLVSNTWAGVSALLLGLAIAAVALLRLRVRALPAGVPLGLAGALLIVTAVKVIGVLSDVGTVGGGRIGQQTLPSFTIEAGFGLWVLVAASVIAFFAALLPVLPKPGESAQLALPSSPQ